MVLDLSFAKPIETQSRKWQWRLMKKAKCWNLVLMVSSQKSSDLRWICVRTDKDKIKIPLAFVSPLQWLNLSGWTERRSPKNLYWWWATKSRFDLLRIACTDKDKDGTTHIYRKVENLLRKTTIWVFRKVRFWNRTDEWSKTWFWRGYEFVQNWG